MSNGTKLKTTLDLTRDLYGKELNPITNLPNDEDQPSDLKIEYPADIKTTLDIARYLINPGVHAVTDVVPEVYHTNYYGMDDVDWDIRRPDKVDATRAANQSGTSQFFGMLNQLVIGEVGGGMLKAVGAMVDIMDGNLKMDFTNRWTELGNMVRDWTKDVTPIYKANSASWDPGDSAWWYNNLVNLGSTLSLLLPGYGIVRGVNYLGKGAKFVAGAAKGAKSAKIAKLGAKAEGVLTLSKTGKWLTNSVIMGTSMRHMENYREAEETANASYAKNLEFLKDQTNLEEYLASAAGKQMATELGIDLTSSNTKGLTETSARYLAGKAASFSYNWNYANLAFDILQSMLFLRGGALQGTRPGTMFGGHTRKVKKAQNALLKNPKVPKTRFGKAGAFVKPVVPWALWSYSEGIEEQVNFISMQEGIRRGDILAGNTGSDNDEFSNRPFWDRVDRYYADGELWTATVMGFMGGGIFTGISNYSNRKAQRSMDESRLKEIGGRVEFIVQSLQKQQEAINRGDINGATEQQQLMGLELALNAAGAGNVDLLLEMINDPAYEELLVKNGVTKEEIAANKEELVDIVTRTEKTVKKYANKMTSRKWGWGMANNLARLDMFIQVYDGLIKKVESQMEENTGDNVYSEDQLNIGPNTKARRDSQVQLNSLNNILQQSQQAKITLANEVEDNRNTKEEKEQAEEQITHIDNNIEILKKEIKEVEAENVALKQSSQEDYDQKTYDEEQAYLEKVNLGILDDLAVTKKYLTWNRDLAWTKLQEILNEEDDKITPGERTNVQKVAPVNEEIAASALTTAILQDFNTLRLTHGSNLTEKQIQDFLAQYPDNEIIQQEGKEFLELFRAQIKNQEIQDSIDRLRAETAEASDEVKSEVEKKVDKLKKEIFNPKLSRKEKARRTEIEQLYRETKAEGAKRLYGDSNSIDIEIDALFDAFTPTVGVVWGDKIGSLYRDNETNELIFREGSTNREYIVNEEIEGKQYLDSKGNLLTKPTLGYLDMMLLRESNLDITIIEDGRTFKIDNQYYNNLASNPSSAIEYDKEANVVSVTLTKWDGSKVTFTSPSVTYELADVIETLEAVKRTRFNELIQDDFLIIEHNNKEYIVRYGQVDLFTSALIAHDINGNELTGEINEIVLREANIQLSQAVQKGINNFKTIYNNETKSNDKTLTSRVTEDALSAPEMGPSESIEEAERGHEAQVTATSQTRNESPRVNQTEEDIKSQDLILKIQEDAVEVNEEEIQQIENAKEGKPTEKPPQEVSAESEKLQIVDATTDTESGQTIEEKQRDIITDDTPTSTEPYILKKGFPRAWTPQFMSGAVEIKGVVVTQTLRDKNGNPLPIYSKAGGRPVNMFSINDAEGWQITAAESESDLSYQYLYVYQAAINMKGEVKMEGDRVIETETLIPYIRQGQPQMLKVQKDSVKESDLIRFDVANSPLTGVGTKVILRVEPDYPFYRPTGPLTKDNVVVTVRLASDPNIIISKLSASDRSTQTKVLRDKINEVFEGKAYNDISATIAGKTNGYIINLKKDNKSLQQPISILGDDIILGVAQLDTSGRGMVVYSNSETPSSSGHYFTSGTVYAALPSANGNIVPVRLQTSSLSQIAIDKILSILTTDTINSKAKQSLIEQIVKIPRGLTAQQNFEKGTKFSSLVAMDDFVIKIPFRGKIIGIQYNSEGKVQHARNNLTLALEGKEFLYKSYDLNGNLLSLPVSTVGSTQRGAQKSSLINSKGLNLVEGEIRQAIMDHLLTKMYNIRKLDLNTSENYTSPLTGDIHKNYFHYLSQERLVATDIPGGTQQKFSHSAIYVELPTEFMTVSEKTLPEFLKGKVEVDRIPTIEEFGDEVKIDETMPPSERQNIRDIGINLPIPEEGKIEEIDPNKGIDPDSEFKLRKYEELAGASDLITDTERDWFLSRFGEEGLDVFNRIGYIQLKDGREAFGYYHRGMVTIAGQAPTGTIYWEAFRRIYDLHLTPEEKTAIEMEILDEANISQELKNAREVLEYFSSFSSGLVSTTIRGQDKTYINLLTGKMDSALGIYNIKETIAAVKEDIQRLEKNEIDVETWLAKKFMDYQLTQDETGLGAKIRQFFRELWYYIKNMIGMNSEIERLFRDLNTREYTNYTAEEAAALSNVKVEQLRAKKGYTVPQVEEVTGNIIFNLVGMMEGAYGANWLKELSNPVSINLQLSGLRDQWEKHGRDKLKDYKEESNEYKILKNYSHATLGNVWNDTFDDYGNVTSPGFLSLAVKRLDPQFGIKYKLKKSGKIDLETAPEIEEETSEDEVIDATESQPKAAEHIYGLKFFNTSQKPTLAKEVKVKLGLIKSQERGKLLGGYKFLPFDDVYAYLSITLANTPGGDVISKLKTLAESQQAHALVPEVFEIYSTSSKQWQNKFATHFNKQNIRFETLVIEDGVPKIILTNRNDLPLQIINKWSANRYDTNIFIAQETGVDLIDTTGVTELQTKYNTLPDIIRLKRDLTDQQHKAKYLRGMKDSLDLVGIELGDDAYMALYKDETIKVSDLHGYMFGSGTFQHIVSALEAGKNPYLPGTKESSALKKLANLSAKFRIDHYAASFLSGAKKPIYAINLNTYDSKLTLNLRSDETYENTILSRFNDVFYSPHPDKRHLILDLLYKNPLVRNNFHLSSFDVIKESGNAGRATAYDTMNQNLSAVTRFSMYYNSGLDFTKINTGTKADKNQWAYITLPKIQPNNAYNLWHSGTDLTENGWVKTAAELLKPAVYGELARIARTNKQLFGDNPIALHEEIENVHYKDKAGDNLGNGLRFVEFRELNKREYGFFTNNGRLHQALVNMDNLSSVEEQRVSIQRVLEDYVKKNIGTTLEALVNSNAVTLTADGRYENKSLPTSALAGKAINNNIRSALVEFAVNEIVYKSYLRTLSGPDLAYYKTDKTGNPIIEAGKRAYQSVTPGLDAVWNEAKQYGLPNKFSHSILQDIFKNREAYIYKLLTDVKVNEKTARRISKGYAKINSTDAQGFTTLAFHKRQMESDGSWSDDHQKAYDTYWKQGKMGDSTSRKLLLDPRKTYYYGDRLITDSQGNQIITWEQIKHSTIPLLREFTELYKEAGETKVTFNNLRIRMENKTNPIDMINFSSAVKIGASGVTHVEDLNTIPINYLNTDNLRTPQIITTKIGSNLDGTQKAKLIPGNIFDNNNYNLFGSKVTGKEIKGLYNSVYAERIKRSHDKLVKQLGIADYTDAFTNRGVIGETAFGQAELKFLQNTRDVIVDSLEERDLPDNYMVALNIQELMDDINNYGFESPLSFPPFAKRFESILLSLFKNNILKQRFNGMSVVQVADFGWNVDKSLRIMPHKNGGVYAEVAIPYEMATKLGLKPGDLLDQKVDSKLLELIGYRIPTQGKNSMVALKIVKILPDQMGGVILLPAEITTMMGSDFDIDKMYLMFPEISKTKTKIEAFDLSKFRAKESLDGLSDQALTNALFDITESILTSKNHIAEQLDPLDSPTYQNKLDQYEALGFIENLSDMDINSLKADMYLEKINKDAGMLIGIFSLHATGHAQAQQMNLTLRPGFEVNIDINGKKSHNDLSKIEGFDGRYISSYLSENQNESLDNAKYQRIGRLNITVYNSGVLALLNRAGFSNEGVAIDFLNQPILRKFFTQRYNAEPGINDIQIAREIVNGLNLGLLFDEANKSNNSRPYTPTPSNLKTDLIGDLSNSEVAERQVQILSDFLRYVKVGRDLSKFNTVVSPETLKNTSRLSYFERYNNWVTHINGPTSTIKIGNTTERTEAFKKYGIDAAVNFTSQFIPYNSPGFVELKRNIGVLTGQQDQMLTPELIEVVNSMALFWSLTKKNSPFGSLIYEHSDAIQKLFFSKSDSLLQHLQRVKREYNLTNDPFLGMLYSHESNISKENTLQSIAFNNTTKLSSSQLNLITDRWAELLQDEREEVRTIAQHLVKYSVLTSGFMMGPNSFVDLVPISYWKSSGLTDYFRKEARTMGYENYFDGSAAEQIIRNMFTEQRLLMTINNKDVETSDSIRKNYSMIKNEYFLHQDSVPQLLVNSITPGQQEYVGYFKSYIGDKFRLFKYRRHTQTGAIYQEITPLGSRFRHVEMQADNIEVASINPINTLRFDEIVPEPGVRTITEITEESSNPVGKNRKDIMPRLTPEVKEAVLTDLDNRLITWLDKNFGIPVEKYDNLKKRLGIDAIGMADMANKVVQIDNERDRYTLPEEAGHFYVEMMETPALKRLLDLVSQSKTYQEVLKDYKNIYTEQIMFQKEAAGQILSKFIVGTYTNEIAEEDYGTGYIGLMGTLRKIWNAIKRFFSGSQSAVNDLHAQLTEILGPAASDMIEGVNPGGLTIENIGINKYYALEKNKVEFRNAKGEVVTPAGLAKGLIRKTTRYASSKVPYLRNFTQKDAMDQLLGESEAIIPPTSTDEFYTYDGVKMNRVSKLLEIFQDPFNQREMAVKVAQINSKEGNPFNTADKVQTLWDFLRDDMGTGIHNLIQGIVERKDLNSLLDSLPEQHRNSYREAIPMLRTWVREKESKGSTLYSEVRIADKADLLAGTVDIIEITSTGKRILHDFKTKMAGKFGAIEQKFPSFKGPLASITNNLLNKYRLQLSLYKYIIEEKGISIDELNVVPLEADVSINDQKNITFKNVKLATSQSPIVSKLSNLEPIKKKLIKSAVSYISPDADIKNIQSEKESATLERLFEKAKKQVNLKLTDYVRSGTSETDYARKIKELFNELDELDEKQGLILYTKRAVRDINAAHRRLKELIQANSVTAESLIQIQNFVHAYNNLDEITAMAPLLASHGYENLVQEYVVEAIAKKNLVDELVQAQARPITAQALIELSGNPDLTVDQLERQLLVADGDISFLSRWLTALGDSKDSTLALVDRMVTLQRGKVNRAEHDLIHGTKDRLGLMKLIEDLDAYQESSGINMWNNRDIYDFMLETTQDGKYTGNIVNKLTPEWYKAREEFIAEQLNEGVALSEIVWKEFFNKFDPKNYQSQKFKKLMGLNTDNILRKFYDFWTENYKYANSILPTNYRRNRGDRITLPTLRARAAEKFLERQGSSIGKLKSVVKEMKDEAFGKHEDNIQWGEYVDHQGNPLDYVPIHYVRAIGNEEGQMSPENLSYDLGNSLQMFYTMAVNFQQMNEVLPHLELAKDLTKTRRVTKLKAGVPVLDQLGDESTFGGIDSLAYKRLDDYFNMVVYGKRKKHEGSVTILGETYNAEQIGDAFLTLGSLRVLALNPHAGTANVVFGHLMTWIEAFAAERFGIKNLAQAKAIYYGGVGSEALGNPGLLTDFLSRAPKSKIGLINGLFNVVQEFDEYGRRLPARKLGLRADQGALYFMYTAGEHSIQTQMAIAQMLDLKFQTSKGEVNLWESYKVVENRLELDPEVAEQFSEKDRIFLAEKIQAVYQRIHGIYNTKDRNAIQQYAVGRWAMQFRKWMPSGIQRRFEGGEKLFYAKESKFKKAEWNERLESYVEGNYITTLKFLGALVKEAKQLQFATMPKMYKNLQPWQQANLRRALGEVFGLFVLLGLASLVGYDEDEGPEDMNWARWETLFILKRVQAELLFYNPLGSSFYEILRSPAANMTTIEAYGKLGTQFLEDMLSIIMGGDIERYKRDAGPYKKGDPKINKRFRNVLFFKELFTHPKDKIKFFDLKS